jgi:hypothetical protein
VAPNLQIPLRANHFGAMERHLNGRKESKMPHMVGERLKCDDCGAEIVFIAPCPCPEKETKSHHDICCGQPMRRIEPELTLQAPLHETHDQKKSGAN